MSYTVRNARRAHMRAKDTPRWQVDRETERGPVSASEWHKRYPLTFRALLTFCEVNSTEIDWAKEYGEPGYSAPERGIIFSNWNNIPKALADRLEAQGYELEWSDEWCIDHDSGGSKAYRTSPDSYGWQSSVQHTDDGTMLTPDSDIQDWIDWAKCDTASDATRALPAYLRTKLERAGWRRCDEIYESGFHPGQTDNPKQIAAKLLKHHSAVLFLIDDVGQFDMRFHGYVQTEEDSE